MHAPAANRCLLGKHPQLSWSLRLISAAAAMSVLGTAWAGDKCSSDGRLRYVGVNSEGSRSVWLSKTSAGPSFELRAAQGNQAVDAWSKNRPGLRLSLSLVVSNGNGGTHKLYTNSGNKECLLDTQNQKDGIVLPSLVLPPLKPPPIGVMPELPMGVKPPIGVLPPAPPVTGVMPELPMGVKPPIGVLPPAPPVTGVMPELPMGVKPPIGVLPPAPPVTGVMPELPMGVKPPIGVLPPAPPVTGVMPELPMGVKPPIGVLPPAPPVTGVMPELPMGVKPPIGVLPPAPPVTGVTPELPMGVKPPIGVLPPAPPVTGVMPELPMGVKPPNGVLPPAPPVTGVMPELPMGVKPPIGVLPPAPPVTGVTPELPMGVKPPIGVLPPAPPVTGVMPELPMGVKPPIGVLPPAPPVTGVMPELPMGVKPPIGVLPPAPPVTGVMPELPMGVKPPIGVLPPAPPVIGVMPEMPGKGSQPRAALPPCHGQRQSLDATLGSVAVDCFDPPEALLAPANLGETRGRDLLEGSPWNIWVDGYVSDTEDLRGLAPITSSLQALSIGLDRRIGGGWVAGLMLNMDSSRAEGFERDWVNTATGWGIGPYLGLRLTEQWSMDAALSFGQDRGRTQLLGLEGEQSGRRKQAMVSARGQYEFERVLLRPRLSWSYAERTGLAYSLNGLVLGTAVSLPVGENSSRNHTLEAALELNHSSITSAGTRVMPYAELGLQYVYLPGGDTQEQFGSGASEIAASISSHKQSWRGSLRAGMRVAPDQHTMLDAGGGYLSLGQNGVNIWEFRVMLSRGF
ncbi:autotransporter outer membrane beta-barrel domain-containing protein [Paucibacter sp. TC2R-5]|uniref:autotransporter outer membrane beta-barrel domain-containing protein n=1 Tax=Paucibacter sp. TC2R-5 TaxID=2893555 RepID=UPI0021E476F2|nr:autotransporter domain-containing protein [Paucibacter sp. TC2R-5]